MLKSLKKVIGRFARTAASYRRFLGRSTPLDTRAVLLESQQGLSMSGNLFYIVKELCNKPEYSCFKLNYVVRKDNRDAIRRYLNLNGLDSVNLLERDSKRYVSSLATSKWLITDNGFPSYFIKREGQVIWNTWHGTPLKTLGRSQHSQNCLIGNMQKNLALADYLQFQNRYSKDKIMGDYMINSIFTGRIIYAGYPRNTAFLTEAPPHPGSNQSQRKRVYAYMPTFRVSRQVDTGETTTDLNALLRHLDHGLNDNEMLYVHAHVAESATADFDNLEKVRPFPEGVEVYQFLNTCDALITDYSSVMFDFALTGKKIVLFAYDEYDYRSNRGLYLNLTNLPFTVVRTVEDLLRSLRDETQNDYTSFKAQFLSYESQNVTQSLCERILLDGRQSLPERQAPAHDNSRALIFLCDPRHAFGENNELDERISRCMARGYEVFLSFPAAQLGGHLDYLETLPESVKYIPVFGAPCMRATERLWRHMTGYRCFRSALFTNKLRQCAALESRRRYGNILFESIEVVGEATPFDLLVLEAVKNRHNK